MGKHDRKLTGAAFTVDLHVHVIAVMVVFLHTAKDGFSEVEDILSLNV